LGTLAEVALDTRGGDHDWWSRVKDQTKSFFTKFKKSYSFRQLRAVAKSKIGCQKSCPTKWQLNALCFFLLVVESSVISRKRKDLHRSGQIVSLMILKAPDRFFGCESSLYIVVKLGLNYIWLLKRWPYILRFCFNLQNVRIQINKQFLLFLPFQW
jgi:hypothetical protein